MALGFNALQKYAAAAVRGFYSSIWSGDATSWLVMQANYDLKTLATMGAIQRQVPVREQPGA